ncbi:MAG TPA: 3-hydroxyacyl-CoA dehydrogenase family protein [Candidatus Nanopelagicaceae bacterium]|nr:3-hydroxyacyl-CoA dehydrogenase family protein [Candidatus Nanopelagicaceae bacterium]
MVDLSRFKTFVVVGAGTMGREIAQVALMSNLFEKVILNDINENALITAKKYITTGLEKIESKGKLGQGLTTDSLIKKLITTKNLITSIKEADFVVEAIPEVMELKQDLFKELGEYALEHAVLATNTSTMSISKIAEASNRPEQVIGMHFFTPIPLLRLIELIKGEKTSQEAFDIGVAVGQKLPALKGKRYIAKIEKESPGFIVNRLTIATSLLFNWILDIATDKGIPYEKIDNDFVSPPELGPLAKWDYLGLDVVCDVMNYFVKEISPEFAPGKTLTNLLKEGNLGRKTGKGIYEWAEGKPNIKTNEKAGLFNPEQYYAIQLNEGCKLLEEEIVSGYKVIDDTMLAGMDMPGPFGAGKKNYEKWSQMLIELAETTQINYFKPCDMMKSGEFLNFKN